MKIGNIVTDLEINIGPEYNYLKCFEDVDSKLPTLIIGYELTKSICEDVDMFNRKLSENVFWTFSKKEYRKLFNSDVEDFIDYVYKYSVKNVNYFYIDFIQSNNLYTIVKKLLKMDNFITFYYKSMIYIYNKEKNVIIGLDLMMLEFLNINIEKIKLKIKSKSSVFLEDNGLIIEYINYVEKLDNDPKYIPFLYSIINYD